MLTYVDGTRIPVDCVARSRANLQMCSPNHGSGEYVALAGVLALISAGFLILARLMRLGFLADFLSRTVLIGFLTGVGIRVALGQISGIPGLNGWPRHAGEGLERLSTTRTGQRLLADDRAQRAGGNRRPQNSPKKIPGGASPRRSKIQVLSRTTTETCAQKRRSMLPTWNVLPGWRKLDT